MTWKGRTDDICGINVDYHADSSITAHQLHDYIAEIFDHCGLSDVTTCPTKPLDAKFNVDLDITDTVTGDILAGHQEQPFDINQRALIGWLMYLRATQRRRAPSKLWRPR